MASCGSTQHLSHAAELLGGLLQVPHARPVPCRPPCDPAGTFLYVAYMEVIPKELRDPSNMPLKLAALLTGFCLMSLLAVWA